MLFKASLFPTCVLLCSLLLILLERKLDGLWHGVLLYYFFLKGLLFLALPFFAHLMDSGKKFELFLLL